MITLADNPVSERVNNHSAHHRVRLSILPPTARKLQAATHIFLVFSYVVHAAKIRKNLFSLTFFVRKFGNLKIYA
jgi:hypothetical protein